MNSATKHIALILLLLFGISQSTTWVFSNQINQHRKQQRAKRDKHPNETIVLTQVQYKEVKVIEEDEIMLHGKMFDVHSVKFEKDKVILHGHFDTKEDVLMAAQKSHESKKEEQSKTYKFPTLFFEKIEPVIRVTFLTIKKNKFILFSDKTQSVYLNFDSPPPRLV